MRKVQTVSAIPVRVIRNTHSNRAPSWAKIVDARTNKVLHTGRPAYIRKVAEKRYNVIPSGI